MTGPCTFPRTARIRKRAEYQEVFAEGRRLKGRYFVCVVAGAADEESKLGIAASRKVGGAVVRNRVKRRVRELFRTHRMIFTRHARVVVIARPEAGAADWARLRRDLLGIWRRGGLLDGTGD